MFEKIQGLINSVVKKEFAKASIYYVAANIIGQGVVLLSSAIFTRMMSKADFGLVSTYSTWVLILNAFVCLSLFVSVRTAYVDFEEDYDDYNSSVLLLCILCGIVMTVAITGINALCGMRFGTYEVLLACTQSVALNFVNYMMAVQAMKNEYKQRTFMMIAPNWTHIVLSIVLMFIFSSNQYMAKIAGNAFGILVFGLMCVVIMFCKARPRIIPRYWKYALKISVPFIFFILSELILIQCDRLMLTALSGAEETAEYSVVYNLSYILVGIYQAINGAWLPWFFDRVKENDVLKSREINGYYILIFTVISCGMMTVAPEMIKIISPKNYWNGISYIAPLIMASFLIFLYAFFTSYMLYQKRTTRIAVNTIIAAVLNLMINYYLIPDYGAKGAVTATLISYVVLFLLHLIAIKKDGIEYFCIGKMWLYIIITSGYGVWLYLTKDNWMLRYAVLIVIMIVLYYTYGKKLLISSIKIDGGKME